MADLSSLYILVTRPGAAGAELCAEIETLGGKALHFPSIAFAPPPDESAYQQAIHKMGEQDWIIFNSPQAVRAAVPAMRAAWPNFPERVRFAAVGAGTAKALSAAGYVGVSYPTENWTSEGLLEMPEFAAVSAKKIMVVRGAGGREILEKILHERGAQVSSCIAYQRILPVVDAGHCLELIQNNRLHLIVAGSYESVANLPLLLGSHSWQMLRQIPLIVMSERVKKLAAESGFQTIWVQPASRQVIDLILQEKETLCQTSKK